MAETTVYGFPQCHDCAFIHQVDEEQIHDIKDGLEALIESLASPEVQAEIAQVVKTKLEEKRQRDI